MGDPIVILDFSYLLIGCSLIITFVIALIAIKKDFFAK